MTRHQTRIDSRFDLTGLSGEDVSIRFGPPEISPTSFAYRILGVVPHPGQSQFIECRSNFKVAACGRRWGKTFSSAIELLWYAMSRPGSQQFVIAPTADQSKIMHDLCVSMALNSPLAGLVSKHVSSPYPELWLDMMDEDGHLVTSIIRARSSGVDGKGIRGHGADRIVLDEAAFIPTGIIREVIQPLLANSTIGGELVAISTPFGFNHFYEDFQRGMASRPPWSFQYPSDTSPHVKKEYLAEQRELLTADQYATEYEAQFTEDQASVFKRKDIEAAVDDSIVLGEEWRPGRIYAMGFDPAEEHDRSAVAVLDYTKAPAEPERCVDLKDIAGRGYIAQSKRVAGMSRRYNDADISVDTTRHEQMLEQLRDIEEVPAQGYKFTNESKANLVEGLARIFENHGIKIPNDPHLLKELFHYRFTRLPSGLKRYGAPEGVGMFDDFVTALALAHHAAQRHDYVPWKTEEEVIGEIENEEERKQAYREHLMARLDALEQEEFAELTGRQDGDGLGNWYR